VVRIASASNPRIAAAARALRRGERVPIEGARLLGEALDAGVVPQTLFHVAGGVPEELLARALSRGTALVEVTDAVLVRLSDLASTRGSIALATLPAPRSAPLSRSGLGLVLDGVQDPANVGAILRCAEAFAVECVVTTAGSASPFTSRALRVSAGSAFRIPIGAGLPARDALEWARSSGALLVGAQAHGGEAPAVLAGARPLVLVIGSEGQGISREVEAELARRVTIPLAGRAESLNAGAAAAVLLYALASPKTSAAKR
jgi:TrmH family RNA methyltransferase